jgi:GNAT superfamily N-acetyltransferase
VLKTYGILRDATDAELAIAIEDNLFALFRAMSALPGSELVQTPELGRHNSPPTNPMFKGVWGARLDPERVDATIDEVIAWFERRRAPLFFWWTGPSTSPTDFGELLEKRGLISMEEQTHLLAAGLKAFAKGAPGMAADLQDLDGEVLRQVPRRFAIEEVRDEAALDDFKRVLAKAYGVPDFAAKAWVDATLTFGIESAPWRLYVGRLDGEPVATSMLFNGAGVASVYAVATLEAARGKGIGGAITLAPLLEARDEGYRHAVLFSSAIGVHAYERIGFRTIDAWIDRYLWRKA